MTNWVAKQERKQETDKKNTVTKKEQRKKLQSRQMRRLEDTNNGDKWIAVIIVPFIRRFL